MSKRQKPPQEAKIIAIANQKGGTAKTTSTVKLGIGLANQGKRVLLVDADPQGDLTTALGWTDADNLSVTLTTQMERIIRDEPCDCHEGILHHNEGVDLVPTNIELSGMEMTLVNAMSREFTLKNCLSELKKEYDYILIDCMPNGNGTGRGNARTLRCRIATPIYEGINITFNYAHLYPSKQKALADKLNEDRENMDKDEAGEEE